MKPDASGNDAAGPVRMATHANKHVHDVIRQQRRTAAHEVLSRHDSRKSKEETLDDAIRSKPSGRPYVGTHPMVYIALPHDRVTLIGGAGHTIGLTSNIGISDANHRHDVWIETAIARRFSGL